MTVTPDQLRALKAERIPCFSISEGSLVSAVVDLPDQPSVLLESDGEGEGWIGLTRHDDATEIFLHASGNFDTFDIKKSLVSEGLRAAYRRGDRTVVGIIDASNSDVVMLSRDLKAAFTPLDCSRMEVSFNLTTMFG